MQIPDEPRRSDSGEARFMTITTTTETSGTRGKLWSGEV